MSIEQSLERVERELIRLTKTMQELVSLYVDTNANPILGDLPEISGFVPTLVKDRAKRAHQRDAISYELHEVRSIVNDAINILGSVTVESHLAAYDATTLGHLDESNYYALCTTLLECISEAES